MRTSPTRIPVCIALFMGLTGLPAKAATLYFSEPDFVWHHTGGLATPYHIWVRGDYWAQTFTGTGQPTADQMLLTLFVNSNLLTSGNQLNLDVILNANVIGSLSIPSGLTGAQTYQFTFSPFSGPDYSIKLLATNTVPPLGGAVSIGLDQRSCVTLVPEPAALALLALPLVCRRPRR